MISPDQIKTGDRARKVYKGIDTLAASINELGLLHPIVVTADFQLVAGGRRLEAVRELGWEMVPVTVVTNLTDAKALLQAESDENTERMPLTPTEAEELASAIESVLKPMAAERVGGRPSKTSGKLPAVSEPRPRETAAKATGFSEATIRKVREVKETVTTGATEPIREAAQAALDEMDATGKVDAAHKKLKEKLTVSQYVEMFPDLQYYVDNGQTMQAIRLGAALCGYAEPELSMRLGNLRLSIAADQRRALRPTEPPPGPDYRKLADRMFLAINDAAQVISKSGGIETLRNAMESADQMTVQLWREQFADMAETLTTFADAAKPTLRRIK